jgi:hypothetical protein
MLCARPKAIEHRPVVRSNTTGAPPKARLSITEQEQWPMNTGQIEIIMLLDCSTEEHIGTLPMGLEIEPNSFAIAADARCILIGAISLESQTKSDSLHEGNLKIQRGTHSVPCSFIDAAKMFGSDLPKVRIIDAGVASFEDIDQFVIPRTGDLGLIVEATLDLPKVWVAGLNRNHKDGLLKLIAMEAAAGALQPVHSALRTYQQTL